ncbi:MAG: hypothetical protein AB8D78_12495 [Akkermansiaceae bacterium]
MLKNLPVFSPHGIAVSCLLTLLVAALTISARAQEIMVVEQLSVRSDGSTLISVDSEGKKVSLAPANESESSSSAVVSQIGPGERVEVSGNDSAQMIISEGVTAHLAPGTQIEIPKVEEGQKATASLKLLKGKMFIKVDAEKLKGTSGDVVLAGDLGS